MRVFIAAFMLAASVFGISPVEGRLDKQLRFWQKRLGLEEWKLSVEVVRQTALSREVWGSAEWDPDVKTGVIRVLDPRDYNLRGEELRLDMECTIVHELVHIQVSALDARDAGVREDVVNKIMTALLNRPCPN